MLHAGVTIVARFTGVREKVDCGVARKGHRHTLITDSQMRARTFDGVASLTKKK